MQVAGFTSPLGSQNDVADTRQRRSSDDFFQNELASILSSHTLVTGRGALSFCRSMIRRANHMTIKIGRAHV